MPPYPSRKRGPCPQKDKTVIEATRSAYTPSSNDASGYSTVMLLGFIRRNRNATPGSIGAMGPAAIPPPVQKPHRLHDITPLSVRHHVEQRVSPCDSKPESRVLYVTLRIYGWHLQSLRRCRRLSMSTRRIPTHRACDAQLDD